MLAKVSERINFLEEDAYKSDLKTDSSFVTFEIPSVDIASNGAFKAVDLISVNCEV